MVNFTKAFLAALALDSDSQKNMEDLDVQKSANLSTVEMWSNRFQKIPTMNFVETDQEGSNKLEESNHHDASKEEDYKDAQQPIASFLESSTIPNEGSNKLKEIKKHDHKDQTNDGYDLSKGVSTVSTACSDQHDNTYPKLPSNIMGIIKSLYGQPSQTMKINRYSFTDIGQEEAHYKEEIMKMEIRVGLPMDEFVYNTTWSEVVEAKMAQIYADVSMLKKFRDLRTQKGRDEAQKEMRLSLTTEEMETLSFELGCADRRWLEVLLAHLEDLAEQEQKDQTLIDQLGFTLEEISHMKQAGSLIGKELLQTTMKHSEKDNWLMKISIFEELKPLFEADFFEGTSFLGRFWESRRFWDAFLAFKVIKDVPCEEGDDPDAVKKAVVKILKKRPSKKELRVIEKIEESTTTKQFLECLTTYETLRLFAWKTLPSSDFECVAGCDESDYVEDEECPYKDIFEKMAELNEFGTLGRGKGPLKMQLGKGVFANGKGDIFKADYRRWEFVQLMKKEDAIMHLCSNLLEGNFAPNFILEAAKHENKFYLGITNRKKNWGTDNLQASGIANKDIQKFRRFPQQLVQDQIAKYVSKFREVNYYVDEFTVDELFILQDGNYVKLTKTNPYILQHMYRIANKEYTKYHKMTLQAFSQSIGFILSQLYLKNVEK